VTPTLDARKSLGLPALAVIERDGIGGVSEVARLVARALEYELGAPPTVISLDQRDTTRVSAWRKLRFTAKVLTQNALHRADWLFYAHPGIASAQSLVPRSLRRPYVVQLHGTDAWETAPSRAVRGATLRIAPSQYTIRRAQTAFPEIGPIALCPHGLPPRPPPSGPVDEALLSRIGPASALIIGRLLSTERRKGHDQLLECWAAVRACCPDAQLVVAGNGDDLPRLERKAADLGVADAVVFCGYVSDATRDALLRRAALFVMPSQQEGFGLVYLEAMRAGLPCVGALDDGATEPIVDGVTGLLVRHDDRQALAQAVAGLLLNRELRRSYGAAGQRRFETHFTFEAYQSRLLMLLEEHLSRESLRDPRATRRLDGSSRGKEDEASRSRLAASQITVGHHS